MSLTDELYKETILDHYRSPRNRVRLRSPATAAHGYNPVCGDEIEIALQLDGETVTDVGFAGKGCSISQASASMMTEAIKGQSLADVGSIVTAFKQMMLGSGPIDEEKLGDLEALQGVRKLPVRVKCATLAWNTLQEAIESYQKREAK